MIDPWDGKEKPTSSYTAIGYSTIERLEENPGEDSESEDMSELQDCKTDLSECKVKQERYRDERDDARNEKNQLKEENADLQKQVSEYAENETKLTEENEKLRDDVDSLEAELADCEGHEENDPFEMAMDKIRQEMVESGARLNHRS